MNKENFFYIRKSEIIILIISILCFLIAAFRPFSMGTDTSTYVQMYQTNNLKSIDDSGFIVLVHFLQLFTLNPRILFVICSFAICYLFARSVNQLSDNPLLSFILFVFLYYFASLNVMRQFVAVAFFYGLALPQLRRNNLTKYLLYGILSFLFHFSTIILLVFYFFSYKTKVNKKIYFIVWLLSLSVLVLHFSGAIQFVMDTLSRLQVFPDIARYGMEYQFLVNSEKTNYQLYLFNVIYFFIFFNYKKISDKNRIFFDIYSLNLIILNVLGSWELAYRIEYSLGIALVFILGALSRFYKRWFPIAFVLFAISLFYYNFILLGKNEVF